MWRMRLNLAGKYFKMVEYYYSTFALINVFCYLECHNIDLGTGWLCSSRASNLHLKGSICTSSFSVVRDWPCIQVIDPS